MKPVNRVRETRRALTRLIDEFGADILVNLNIPDELTPMTRLKLRYAAEERVRWCTACPLHKSRGGETEAPLEPYWSPWRMPRAGRIAVIVDAPTMQEHKADELGHGPLFNTVRGELRGHGIDRDQISYLTTVACTPIMTTRSGEKRRTPPDPAHAAICVSNLMQSLEAADVDYVLLLGGHAVRAWRHELPLDAVRGRWFVWCDRWMVFPAEHPATMLARGKTTAARTWREDIERFCAGVRDRVGTEALGGGCIKDGCKESEYACDDDGVPWCRDHLKLGKAIRDGRRVKTVDTTQQQLM